MKHHLSFCIIEQLSHNVFETIAIKNAVINKNCADESWIFWHHLRDKPFGLLVNCQNPYSHSFEGSREIGKHPFQQKTAILMNNNKLILEMKTTMEIKKSTGDGSPHQFFSDRNEAIKWLSDI